MLNKDYWNHRYQNDNTPWNAGSITSPLKACIDQLDNPELRILIPGAGHGHEAIYLHQKGFKNVLVCDWAPEAIQQIKAAQPDFADEHLICDDFFNLDLKVDLIIEQTFFCAISPELRSEYVRKSAALLREGGQIVGLLFASEFDKPGPPFGGTKATYQKYFAPLFYINQMEFSPNSILPRAGNELFFRLSKK